MTSQVFELHFYKVLSSLIEVGQKMGSDRANDRPPFLLLKWGSFAVINGGDARDSESIRSPSAQT